MQENKNYTSTGVPDEAFFGLLPDGKGIHYGDVRNADDEKKLFLLECRLRNLLIKQIHELYKPEHSERKVYAPFPLAIMTCIAIETLGEIFYFFDQEPQKFGFVKVVKQFDKEFSRSLTKEFKIRLKARFPKEGVDLSNNRAEIIYSYFRNTFIHAYKGRAVFLEEEIVDWENGDGYIVLNPNWFWKTFLTVFEKYFNELKENKELTNSFRRSALAYIDDLLK